MSIEFKGRRAAVVAVSVWVAACSAPQVKEAPKPPPTAKVQGLRVLITPAPAVSASSDECRTGSAALVAALPNRLQKAAEKALADRGFQVLNDPESEYDLAAKIDSVVSYCNPRSQIATGEVGLSLVEGGRLISRAVVTGDLVNPVEHLFEDVLAQHVHSQELIQYADSK